MGDNDDTSNYIVTISNLDTSFFLETQYINDVSHSTEVARVSLAHKCEKYAIESVYYIVSK